MIHAGEAAFGCERVSVGGLDPVAAARRHITMAAKTHTVPHYMGDVARMHARRLAR